MMMNIENPSERGGGEEEKKKERRKKEEKRQTKWTRNVDGDG